MVSAPVNNELSSHSGESYTLLCRDLPTKARPEIGKILVTGASGYIGGRLVPELVARGYSVRIMVRRASPEYRELWSNAEIVVADALDINRVKIALEDVDTAYYLIHSLLMGPKGVALTDIQAAINFRIAAEQQQVKRIIYLGALGDSRSSLSAHLQSRAQVAKELVRGKVPVTILRAATVIGSGSASYEIIKHLVKNLPVVFIPRCAKHKCQPIGIRDVIKYLVGVLEIPETAEKAFDIGGADILTYEEMLRTLAELLNAKRLFIPLGISNIKFCSYIASLVTPIPAPITLCLLEGLNSEVICQETTIRSFLPFAPLTYKEAIIRAMNREEQDIVYTRWSNAYPPAHELALKLHEIKNGPHFTTSYSVNTEKEGAALFESICKVGGKEGWFSKNWAWRMRGWVDKMFMGVGTSRGRRSQSSLKINDVIDFWRVEDLQPNRRLLLRAEMKLPGRAWLEFTIDDENSVRKLFITAHYHTSSLLGKIYWYIFLPFHNFIFHDLIKAIEKRS